MTALDLSPPLSAGRSAFDLRLARVGEWLRTHQRAIQRIQWIVVVVYLALIGLPPFLPLPDRAAHVWSDLTLFAQFCFWGLWWPFVLLSMVLVGRAWCGLLCPEGALTEHVSRWSRGWHVPRWLTWKGWPFAAFALTTIYGQLVSVYQYPKPVLLVLGGSTLGAVVVGLLYGRSKRVWCRYLCPVTGVFGVLSKLAPFHFRVDEEAWRRSPKPATVTGSLCAPQIVNCAPLVPIRTMKGGSLCHMCGRCSDFRGAVTLSRRRPNHEIVYVAGADPKPWETALIVFGLMGIAFGAFQWSNSTLFVDMKQLLAEFLIDHGATWLLEPHLPWWMLTNYPDRNDTLSPLDGAMVLAFIAAAAVVIGGGVTLCVAAATRMLGGWRRARFHHLVQSLIPIAGCGVFLGLSATTVTLLRGDGFELGFVMPLRMAMLAGAGLWSLTLAWQITGRYTPARSTRAAALACMAGAIGLGMASWVSLFVAPL